MLFAASILLPFSNTSRITRIVKKYNTINWLLLTLWLQVHPLLSLTRDRRKTRRSNLTNVEERCSRKKAVANTPYQQQNASIRNIERINMLLYMSEISTTANGTTGTFARRAQSLRTHHVTSTSSALNVAKRQLISQKRRLQPKPARHTGRL